MLNKYLLSSPVAMFTVDMSDALIGILAHLGTQLVKNDILSLFHHVIFIQFVVVCFTFITWVKMSFNVPANFINLT